MITPPKLRKGDTIGIVAPARKVIASDIENAAQIFQQWGLNVKLSPYLFQSYHQFAGNDAIRIKALQELIDDDEIKAIFCARGGYGCLRIVDFVDFSPLLRNPKWIIGFSDITVFHSHIHRNVEMKSLHALMPFNLAGKYDAQSLDYLRQFLFEGSLEYNIKPHSLNKVGETKATLVGGNLSMLYAINNSPSDIDTYGKILFIEDVDEYLYHIDRMMVCLKRSGKLNHLAGLIVGGMTDMKDNQIPFGKAAEEIIFEHTKDFNYPIVFNFPAGHGEQNFPLVMGATYQLQVNADTVFLQLAKD